MKRICTFAAAVTAAAAAAGSAGAATPTLKAFVNDSFKIGVTQGGKPVKSLKAGKYVIAVTDPSTSHNFHITGPGLNKIVTTVSFVGTKSLTVTLKKGVYKFVCDPHLTTMHGVIVVK